MINVLKKGLRLVQRSKFAFLGIFSWGSMKGFQNSLGVDNQKNLPTPDLDDF